MSTLEYGYTSLNKKGEELCGDKVECINSDHGCTLVLADGLGSGVKANILSTLTSKILCTMIASGIALSDCIDTIISSLPVCKTRGVAYSTFSILSLNDEGKGYLVEFDNPLAIMLRNGKNLDLKRAESVQYGKKINISEIQMLPGDVIILMSDGVIHAGVGELLNFGWDRKEIIEFSEVNYSANMSARSLASIVANACYDLYAHLPGDDTTVLAVKYRKKLTANIMIGPPINKDMDEMVVKEFMETAGKKIVCGGTSSQVVARCLNKELSTSFDYVDKDVPPIGYIDGIDLTTEGVLTIRKLMQYSSKYLSTSDPDIKLFNRKDGASLLANMLLIDASDVNIFVGRNVNIAHEGLGIDNKTKLTLVTQLEDVLRKLGKEVTIKYY